MPSSPSLQKQRKKNMAAAFGSIKGNQLKAIWVSDRALPPSGGLLGTANWEETPRLNPLEGLCCAFHLSPEGYGISGWMSGWIDEGMNGRTGRNCGFHVEKQYSPSDGVAVGIGLKPFFMVTVRAKRFKSLRCFTLNGTIHFHLLEIQQGPVVLPRLGVIEIGVAEKAASQVAGKPAGKRPLQANWLLSAPCG